MPEVMPTVSDETISGWVGLRNSQLGRSYVENGSVFDLRLQGAALKARCQGSMPQPYRLRAVLANGRVEDADCSCPVGSGGRCKHVGALLLTWLERSEAFRVVAELDADLEQRSKGELVVLIKRMLRLQPDLESLLEMDLPGGDGGGAPVNPEIYRRQVASAFRLGRDDWMASRRIAVEIGVVLDAGEEFLVWDDCANAVAVFRSVSREMLEHYDQMLDEDGRLIDVMDRCVEGLGQCLALWDDVAGRESLLRTLFDVYCADLDWGGIGLGEGAPGVMLEQATVAEKQAVAGWVRAAMGHGVGKSDSFRREAHGRFLLELEKEQLDDASFLGICREARLLEELVDRLLTLGRLEEAIAEAGLAEDHELLELADIFCQHDLGRRIEPLLAERVEANGNQRLMERLKEHHLEQGKLPEALDLAKRLLERRPDLSGYAEARELSRQLGVWEELRSQLLGQWSAAGEYGLLTEVYLEEGEIDLALRSVNRELAGLHGGHRTTRVAEAAAATRPQAALDIYRRQVEGLIAARGRENYQAACAHLTRIRDLYRNLPEEPGWLAYVGELKERHRRLPALREELDNAGL